MNKTLWCDLHSTESRAQEKHHGWAFSTKNWTNSSIFASLLPSLPPGCYSAKFHDVDAAPCCHTPPFWGSHKEPRASNPAHCSFWFTSWVCLFYLFQKQTFLRNLKDTSTLQTPQLPTKSPWASSPNFCHFLQALPRKTTQSTVKVCFHSKETLCCSGKPPEPCLVGSRERDDTSN